MPTKPRLLSVGAFLANCTTAEIGAGLMLFTHVRRFTAQEFYEFFHRLERKHPELTGRWQISGHTSGHFGSDVLREMLSFMCMGYTILYMDPAGDEAFEIQPGWRKAHRNFLIQRGYAPTGLRHLQHLAVTFDAIVRRNHARRDRHRT
jgi:hypothetical protein